ncbi:DUF3134 domain-containing protein [Leptothoe spongobia]|uniref:DUF3134 domain-containing protein n=1 Tax=Leptothoe spongobia TAU-MAC 1115 TaxID=1967444 RepID=A0A947GLT2_9CYAN|nr:DUF3134 domain-containing protein [Leptothoe spongobia]MBT9317232.1 DUF3134 domain-containing protein [Leptothoe spongobia TAU-MAC 1115]
MTKYNPSVRQIPRKQHASVIPERGDSSILRWLENTGRLIPREPVEGVRDEADSEEISDLMGSEDQSFDDSDDSDNSSDSDDSSAST